MIKFIPKLFNGTFPDELILVRVRLDLCLINKQCLCIYFFLVDDVLIQIVEDVFNLTKQDQFEHVDGIIAGSFYIMFGYDVFI